MVTREALEMGTIMARSVNSKRDRKGLQTNSTNKAGKKQPPASKEQTALW